MKEDPAKLRRGWTTGACATAAAVAAGRALTDGFFPDPVTITLPKGEEPSFALLHKKTGPGWAEAGVVKDAGDDPDVTHGVTVVTRIASGPPGIRFHAGEGVGTVTKPGLPIPPGEAAINPVPRQMIEAVLREICSGPPGFDVTISIPGGARIAQQTWNPRLGIQGGLSILGTTGVVRPFSCSAWIASIHRGIDVARANGLIHVVGATGATSEKTVAGLYDLPEIAFLDMGDFAGGLLKYLRRHPVPKLTVAGGIGKMTKLAQGALDLHSARSQVDFADLAQMASEIGADAEQIAGANTALEALQIAGPALAQQIAPRAHAVIQETLRDAPVQVEVIIIDRAGTLLARHEAP
ncbi:MAG: cobalt-precorrin-5B (C(1))-methyltransferase [Pseudomonadota bacterium]